ncbi:MAG: drug/metabolite transporter (DMT)-like permease [Ilumatobacter sp.]
MEGNPACLIYGAEVPKLSPNALGSLYMVIGSLGYVINDGFVRRVSDDGPGIYQVLFIRSLGLAALFLIVGSIRGERPRRSHVSRPLLLRVAAEMISTALFFAAIVRMEFANAQATLQVTPFAVTLAAAVVLRERVSRRQYAAILLGFVGVLIVARPATDGFSGWSLAVLASAGFLVAREFATHNVDEQTPALSIAFLTAVGIAVLMGLLSIIDGWAPFTARSVLFLAVAVCSLSIGYIFTIQTVRVGDLSVSAPFRYTVLVGAVVVGYVMFSEVPDVLTIVGSTVIIATGLWAVRLERRST